MKNHRHCVVAACFAGIILSCVPAHSFAAEKRNDGWKSLFNGKNLDGWYIYLAKHQKNEDTNHLVQIHDGAVHMYLDAKNGTQQSFGYISTEKNYSNYHLRFEYKWGTKRFGARAMAKRDAGVIYHMFGGDNVWPSGVECQVQEGDVGDVFTVNTRVATTVDANTTNLVDLVVTNAVGVAITNKTSRPTFLTAKDGGIPIVQGLATSIRRIVRNPMNEHEGWNKVEVIVRGDSSTHIVNGKTNNVAGKMERFVNGEWVPLTEGKIILQLEGAEVFYRNIEIRELER